MYVFESRVRYSEIDHNEGITLPAIINYMQDCTTFHSDSIGYGFEKLKKDHHAWILSYWQIVVNRYPKMGEEIKVCTWPSGFKGMFGDRNFQILDGEGQDAAHAYSLWIYMDMEKGRPVRPPKDEVAAYGMEPPLEMEYESRKITIPEDMTPAEAFPVKRSHIDTNEHVNNCQYVQMAMELLDKNFIVHQLRVEYKKSAVLGDMIIPKLAVEEDRTVVVLSDSEGQPYAVVEFK